MAIRKLSATEVKNRFGRVLREIAKSGGPLYIERDGKPVAVILSIRKYERSRARPRPHVPLDKATLLRSTFGMWSKRSDISDDWIAEGRTRWTSEWQSDKTG